MYAVTFDLDANCLNENAVNLSKVYSDIRKFMEQHGFKWQQGSVCILAMRPSTPLLVSLRCKF